MATLRQLWEQAGQKEFKATKSSWKDQQWFLVKCISPKNEFLGWKQNGCAQAYIDNDIDDDNDEWSLYIEPKKKVSMWPALCHDGDTWYMTNSLFSIVAFEAHKRRNDNSIRLLTEWPAIEVEVDE